MSGIWNEPWDSVKTYVLGVPNAQYRSFQNKNDAISFLLYGTPQKMDSAFQFLKDMEKFYFAPKPSLPPSVRSLPTLGVVEERIHAWVDHMIDKGANEYRMRGMFSENDPKNFDEPFFFPNPTVTRILLGGTLRVFQRIIDFKIKQGGDFPRLSVVLHYKTKYVFRELNLLLTQWSKSGINDIQTYAQHRDRDLIERIFTVFVKHPIKMIAVMGG